LKYREISMLVAAIVVLGATGITAVVMAINREASNEVMPQDVLGIAVYDKNGVLEYFQTVDEAGNVVFLDQLPETIKGDAELNGFFFVSETIDCINGVAAEHSAANGIMTVYKNNGESWSLKQGQAVNFVFNVKAIKDREIPQKIMFGYFKDGVYTEYSDDAYSLKGETAFDFIAPEDGDYFFFFINASSDTIYVKSLVIL